MNRLTKTIFVYTLLAAVIIIYLLFHLSPVRLAQGVYVPKPKPIENFELLDNQGQMFTKNQLKNHWSLLFFGFSQCELICPLTLKLFAQTYQALPKAKKPQVIFISVDPEHDSLEKLTTFVQQFNQQFIALRGSLPEINALQKQLHVTISKTAKSHGTEILLINPQAGVQAYFYSPISSEKFLSDLELLIH